MVDFDATESMTPFREGSGLGAILFDRKQIRQADPEWFLPTKWGERARPVDSGGRGGAWFVDAPFGPSLLRLYLRGGWAARVSRDRPPDMKNTIKASAISKARAIMSSTGPSATGLATE